MADKYLAIYLNDHLAGSTVGLELAKRARGENEGTPLGAFLERLVTEIEEDRETLKRLMDEVGARRDPLKERGAWAAEKLGRLKLNGQLTGYSPLSRLEELEALHMGIAAKLEMWRAFKRTLAGRVDGFDFEALEQRAERQRDEVEQHRLEAAAEAFAGAP